MGRCETDVAFWVLSGSQFPDFKTISDFRKEHLEAFEGLFLEVLPRCNRGVFDNPEWSTLIIGNGPPLSAGGQSRQMLNLRVWW